MSAAAAAQARQVQRVYSEWCVKAAEIILASRVSDPGAARPPLQASASFNLKVPEFFDVRSEAVARPEFFQLKTQRSFQVEIYLSAAAGAPADAPAGEEEPGQLLERWTFTFFPAHPEPTVPDRCNQALVRKLGVTLRSLMCFARLLPAYALCAGPRAEGARHWRFREEAWPPTSRSTSPLELSTQDFVSLQSSVGTLRLSVSQRKDLKAQPSSGPFRSTAAIGSQLDPIEVEEGYFTSAPEAPAPAEASTSLGRLGKIAEEPEAKASGARELQREPHHHDGAEPPAASAGAPSVLHEAAGARGDRASRPRLSSEDSVSSTVSTSSKTHSAPDHVVSLGATPPLASAAWTGPPPGLITLGPHHRSDSACSSRSATPQTSPQLHPSPEPPAHAAEQRPRGPAGRPGPPGPPASPKLGPAPPPGAAGAAGEARAPAAGAAAAAPPAPPAAEAPASGAADGLAAPGAAPGPGELDDLSGIWMSCPPEWGGRRRSSSLGTASRGSGAYSRSQSPEDAHRSAAAASQSSATEGAGAASAWSGGACSSAGPGGQRPPGAEPESEIRLFGMSDDEDEDLASEDEDELERNVVASTIQEGSGAAFAAACVDPEPLGLARLDLLESPPRPASDGSGASPRLLSPLIAQLNPFAPPPSLDLPPPALPEEPAAEPPASPGASGEVRRLLAEMGDLVCGLQQRRALAVTDREVSPEELLERLAHFREVAGGAEARGRP